MNNPLGRHRTLSAHDSHDNLGGASAGSAGPTCEARVGEHLERLGGPGGVGEVPARRRLGAIRRWLHAAARGDRAPGEPERAVAGGGT